MIDDEPLELVGAELEAHWARLRADQERILVHPEPDRKARLNAQSDGRRAVRKAERAKRKSTTINEPAEAPMHAAAYLSVDALVEAAAPAEQAVTEPARVPSSEIGGDGKQQYLDTDGDGIGENTPSQLFSSPDFSPNSFPSQQFLPAPYIIPPALPEARPTNLDNSPLLAQLVEHLIADPGASLGDMASRNGITQAWLAKILSTSQFQSVLAQRQIDLISRSTMTIEERAEAVTKICLDRLADIASITTDGYLLKDTVKDVSRIHAPRGLGAGSGSPVMRLVAAEVYGSEEAPEAIAWLKKAMS